jgi:hypothetical protein
MQCKRFESALDCGKRQSQAFCEAVAKSSTCRESQSACRNAYVAGYVKYGWQCAGAGAGDASTHRSPEDERASILKDGSMNSAQQCQPTLDQLILSSRRQFGDTQITLAAKGAALRAILETSGLSTMCANEARFIVAFNHEIDGGRADASAVDISPPPAESEPSSESSATSNGATAPALLETRNRVDAGVPRRTHTAYDWPPECLNFIRNFDHVPMAW